MIKCKTINSTLVFMHLQSVLALIVALVTLFSCKEETTVVPNDNDIIIGAIRWDAWHAHSTNPNNVLPVDAVEKSLSPKQYHFRAPFFAKIINDSTIRINGYTQAIIDQEINYAKDAGLDYWAFLLYDETRGYNYGVPMSEALNFYLSSTKKSDINFCVIEDPNLLFSQPETEILRVIKYIKEPSYQMVMGNRPLIYFYGMNDSWANDKSKQILDNLRAQVVAAGFGNPYFVIQNSVIADAKRYSDSLGADAVSRYGVGGEYNANASSYSTLTNLAASWWFNAEKAGVKVVPIVTAGYDRRPRIENPVPWENQVKGNGMEKYYLFPTTGQLTAHLQKAINWAKSRKNTACPSGAILIYAWNEHDEGGWLCPTVDIGNGVDRSRLDEIKAITK